MRPQRDAEPKFVLIHGLASNARMWDGVGAALAERGYASIAVDLRGHGRSPKPPVFGWLIGSFTIAVLLTLATARIAIGLVASMVSGTRGAPLNTILRETARLELIYGCLLALGLMV